MQEIPRQRKIMIKPFRHRCGKKAGAGKHMTPHILRRSLATHHLKSGTDLRYMQELLGQAGMEASAVGAPIGAKTLAKIKRPIDPLFGPNAADSKQLTSPWTKPYKTNIAFIQTLSNIQNRQI